MKLDTKRKTLAHYKRMIEWAKLQYPRNSHNYLDMEKSLGEAWTADHCPYCKEHLNRYDEHPSCFSCPLSSPTQTSFSCCNGLWPTMNKTYTWEGWIIAAEAIVEYIKKQG